MKKIEVVQLPILKNFKFAGDNIVAEVDGYIDTPINAIKDEQEEFNNGERACN